MIKLDLNELLTAWLKLPWQLNREEQNKGIKLQNTKLAKKKQILMRTEALALLSPLSHL